MFLLRTLLAKGSLQIATPHSRTLYGSGAPLVRLVLHRPLPRQPWRRPECRLIDAYRRNDLTITGGTLRDLHYLFYLNRAHCERNPVWQAMRALERVIDPRALDRLIELDHLFGFLPAASCRLARRRCPGRRHRLRRARFRCVLRGRPDPCPAARARIARRRLPMLAMDASCFTAARSIALFWRRTRDAAEDFPTRRNSRRSELRGAGPVRRLRLPRLARGWCCPPSIGTVAPHDGLIRIETG